MVLAWYLDSSDSDSRNEHKTDPPKFVDLDSLKKLSGVLYWKLEGDDPATSNLLQEIRTGRGYNYQDVIDIDKERLPNYEDKLKMFFTEHLHSDEEIRLILDGSCYFDVRDDSNDWIRIQCEKGDLLVLPAGIYHRFTLDTKNYVRAMRLFCGEPVWKGFNRPADDHPSRVAYLAREK